jgi:hypothetical protein
MRFYSACAYNMGLFSGKYDSYPLIKVYIIYASRPVTLLRASCQIQHGRIFSAPVRNQIPWVLVSPVLFHMIC